MNERKATFKKRNKKIKINVYIKCHRYIMFTLNQNNKKVLNMKMTPTMILTAYSAVKCIECLNLDIDTKQARELIAKNIEEINIAIQSLIPDVVLSVNVKSENVKGFKLDFARSNGGTSRSYINKRMEIDGCYRSDETQERYISAYLNLLNNQPANS